MTKKKKMQDALTRRCFLGRKEKKDEKKLGIWEKNLCKEKNLSKKY